MYSKYQRDEYVLTPNGVVLEQVCFHILTQHNSYTNTDCIYSVYVMVLELIVQKFYLLVGSNKNRPQPQIVNNIRVIYRFEVRFVSL